MLSIGMRLLQLFVALSISDAFDRVWRAALLQKRNSYGIAGMSFLSNRQLQVVLDEKPSQENPANAGVPQCSILGPTLFLLYMTLLMMSSVTSP